MKPEIVDSVALYRATEKKRFCTARDCRYFALDKRETPCLWHRSFCRHPDTPDPTVMGHYEHCGLVWRGECPFGEKP